MCSVYVYIVIDDVSSNEAMLLTVEAMGAQLQEQTKLCKEQVHTHTVLLRVDTLT